MRRMFSTVAALPKLAAALSLSSDADNRTGLCVAELADMTPHLRYRWLAMGDETDQPAAGNAEFPCGQALMPPDRR